LSFNGLEGHLEAASGFEPLNKGFAVLGTGITKSYQIFNNFKGLTGFDRPDPCQILPNLTNQIGRQTGGGFW